MIPLIGQVSTRNFLKYASLWYMYCIIDLYSEAESSNHLSRLMEHENALSEYYALGGNM